MEIYLAKHVVMSLNASPPKSSLSTTYIPCTIMPVKNLDRKKSSKIHFGAYEQVNEDRNIMYTLEERTQGAIYLGPTGNLKGTYNFFLLRTKKLSPADN